MEDEASCAEPGRPSRKPALLLFFLAPAIGELLSSSAPPVEFFNPILFVILTILYGGGALLCRELTVRWHKGWWTLLALGAAYGVAEEGLMVKSFFNPDWQDIGALGAYGRWGGVNWVWSVNLTLYHAVISITVPVLLAGLVFPQWRNEPWLTTKSLRIISLLFVCVVLLGLAAFGDGGDDKTPYRPPVIPYNLTLVVAAALVGLARCLPGDRLGPVTATVPPRGRLAAIGLILAGFLAVLGFFVLGFSAPTSGLPATSAVAAMAGYAALLATLVYRRSHRPPEWTPRHQWRLAAGALGFFIAVAPLWEFAAQRPDTTTGMTLVALLALLFLLYVRTRITRAERAAESQGA